MGDGILPEKHSYSEFERRPDLNFWEKRGKVKDVRGLFGETKCCLARRLVELFIVKGY